MSASFPDRRVFLNWIATLPILLTIEKDAVAAKVTAAVHGPGAENIYSRLGVRTLINARGTWTYLSGSLELPETRRAKQLASLHFVDLIELQHAAGKRLAQLSGAESGMVTSGAAGAMAAAAAACMAGTDPAKIWQLPDTTGMKGEVVMFGGRIAFDSAIRLAGAKLVVAQTHDDLRRAINAQTAMVYTTALGDRLSDAIAIAKQAGVPLLLDDAAGIPPIENLRKYSGMGVDLYTFSGGKGLGGPQCTGILLGRKDLIEAAIANCNPYEGAVCRAMKVGKEEIMGCLAAVEAWSKIDLAALNREWNLRVQRISRVVKTIPGVGTSIAIPEDGNRYPTLTVSWDEKAWGFTVADCARQLSDGTPRIEVLTGNNPSMVAGVEEGDRDPKAVPEPDHLQIISMTMQPGEELIVARRLREILSAARAKSA